MANNITKVSRPSTYSDQRDIKILNSWIFQIERYFKLYKISEDKKVLYASTYLINQANTWYGAWETTYLTQIAENDVVPWKDFVIGLRDAFLPPNFHGKLRDQ